jgi:predicted ATPase
MLRRLVVRGFKSLRDVSVELPRFTVLFGPNAAGKSNVLDSVQALSRIAASRTLADALGDPIRGYPIEAFSFPPGGLAELLSHKAPSFSIEADVESGREQYRYRIAVSIQPKSGSLGVADEYLVGLTRRGEPRGEPAIEAVEGKLRVRRKSRPGRPRYEPLGQNFAALADPRLGMPEYRAIDRVRSELSGWRTYYLDPRVAMRAAKPPSEVDDIGVLGQDTAPFLYRLREEHPKHFETVGRTVRALVPAVEDVLVDLDGRRGTLDVQIRQDGVLYSSRIVSEGTLRVLALAAVAANPWGGSLLAFEEPENGVHPRRLDLIAQLLVTLAVERKRQVIVTTHSPRFCDVVLGLSRQHTGEIAMLNVRHVAGRTEIKPFETSGPLFTDQEVSGALANGAEERVFEGLMLRGLLDG